MTSSEKYKVLVFPCGSEIGLEIHRSLKYSMHVDLIGGSSVEDHGKFIYNNYIGNIPFVNDQYFIEAIINIVSQYNIDAIYPAMDSVITKLKRHEDEIGSLVISSDVETTEICLSKTRTYSHLEDTVKIPKIYKKLGEVTDFPVFLKPDIGYGSKNTLIAKEKGIAEEHIKEHDDIIICEYLPGPEYTVDCFSDYEGNLLFVGPRQRKRVAKGISVSTASIDKRDKFIEIASNINTVLHPNGAWFFQVKARENGELVLMEVASRLGGSSCTHRVKGINFALLSIFNAFNIPVSITENDYKVILDRAFNTVYELNINYGHVYLDLDDTLIIGNQVNTEIVKFLYKCINRGKELHLMTKHDGNVTQILDRFKLSGIFDNIIHLNRSDSKSKYIVNIDSIFIDDSYSERNEVAKNKGIHVFSPDMVEALL